MDSVTFELDFWTVNHVSDYLGICAKTVYQLKETIPGYFKIGGRIMFNRRTLIKHTTGHDPKPATPNLPVGSSNRHDI